MVSLRKPLLVSLLVALVLSSCGDESDQAGETLSVVATTTILGDLVAQVAGDEASVEVLMPVGVDPHDFQASAAQIAALNRADLVVANGLGLEEGLGNALGSAESDGVFVLEVGRHLDPIPFRVVHDDEDHQDEDHQEEDHEGEDPHIWLDPLRMARAAELVAQALERIDPGGSWAGRAEAYADELETVDRRISELLAAIPDDKRKLVTGHESLGYFADRYDFEVVGVVIPGGSTLSDPSSAELAALIDKIRAEDVSVIFAETTQASSLVGAIASELGDVVTIVDLFTGSLGEPGSSADTLIGLLITNAELIAEALSG